MSYRILAKLGSGRNYDKRWGAWTWKEYPTLGHAKRAKTLFEKKYGKSAKFKISKTAEKGMVVFGQRMKVF